MSDTIAHVAEASPTAHGGSGQPGRGRRIGGLIVRGRGLAVQYPPRAELGMKRRVFRVVWKLRLFLGVEVVKVAVEFVEPVHCG